MLATVTKTLEVSKKKRNTFQHTGDVMGFSVSYATDNLYNFTRVRNIWLDLQ